MIEWRWKVENTLHKGDVNNREGDDYPARIYITFAFDPQRFGYLERLRHRAARLLFGPDTPYRAITYIWGSRAAAGTMVANAYTDSVMMFVVESGDEQARQWRTERRNLYSIQSELYAADSKVDRRRNPGRRKSDREEVAEEDFGFEGLEWVK